MNIRKNIDYSEMYAALDQIMAFRMSQMEQYCEIGKAVCQRCEKGAAVAAAAYLSEHYPDVHGFSPTIRGQLANLHLLGPSCPQKRLLAILLLQRSI